MSSTHIVTARLFLSQPTVPFVYIRTYGIHGDFGFTIYVVLCLFLHLLHLNSQLQYNNLLCRCLLAKSLSFTS